MSINLIENNHIDDFVIKKVILGSDGQFKCRLSNGEEHIVSSPIHDAYDHDTLMKVLRNKIIEKKEYERYESLINDELCKIPKGERNNILYHMVGNKFYYYLIDDEIVCCSIGKYGNIVSTKEGKVFQVLSSQGNKLKFIPFFIINKMKITSVSVGNYYTVFINDQNEIYLSDPSYKMTSFVKVEHNINEEFKSVYTDDDNTIFITIDGNIYILSNSNNNHLDEGNDLTMNNVPQKVLFDKNIKVYDISLNSEHMMILSNQGEAYLWKRWRFDSSHYNEGSNKIIKLSKLEFFDERVVYITSNTNKYAAIDAYGKLYLWGKLNHSSRILDSSPLIINQKRFKSFLFFEKSMLFETWEGNFISIKNDNIYDTSLSFNKRLEVSNVSIVKRGISKEIFLIVNNDEELAYHYCINNNLHELKRIVENDQSILKYKSLYNNTLFHAATLRGNHEILKYLIEKDDSLIHILNKDRDSALVYATKSKSMKCIDYICAVKPNWSSEIEKCLNIATMNLDLHIIKRLLYEDCKQEYLNLIYEKLMEISKGELDLSKKQKIDMALQLIHDFGSDKTVNQKLNYNNKRRVGFSFSSHDTADRNRIGNILKSNLIETFDMKWRFLPVEDYDAFIFYITPKSLCQGLIDYIYELRCQKKIIFVVISEKEKMESHLPNLKNILTRVTFIDHEYIGKHKMIYLEWVDSFAQNIHSILNNIEMVSFKKDLTDIPKYLLPSLDSIKEHPMRSNIINIYISAHNEDMDEELSHIKDNIHSLLYDKYRKKDYIVNIHHYSHSLNNFNLKKRLKHIKESYPFIICLLGERYGEIDALSSTQHVQEQFDDLYESGFKWINDFRNKSIIDIEIYYTLLIAEENKDMDIFPFFFLRDPKFLKKVKRSLIKKYESESYFGRDMIQNIKNRIMKHPYIKHSVYEKEEFNDIIKTILFDHIDRYIENRRYFMRIESAIAYQNDLLKRHRNKNYQFNSSILLEIQSLLNRDDVNLITITGPDDSGKSSFLTYLYDEIRKYNDDKCVVIHYFEKNDNPNEHANKYILHISHFIETETKRIKLNKLCDRNIESYINMNMVILIDNFDILGGFRSVLTEKYKAKMIVTQKSGSSSPNNINIHSMTDKMKINIIERNRNLNDEIKRELLRLDGSLFYYALKLNDIFEDKSILSNVNSYQDILDYYINYSNEPEYIIKLLNLLKSNKEMTQYNIVKNLNIHYEKFDQLIDKSSLFIEENEGRYKIKKHFQECAIIPQENNY